MINNLAAYHQAIAAVCPIYGVNQDGTFLPTPAATPAQIAAAQGVEASYTDVPPQNMSIDLALSRMTDAEYTALFAHAQTHPNVHRILQYIKQFDLTQTQVQNVITQLVTAGVITAARANVIFVAPPPPPVLPFAPPPQPTPIT